MQVVKRVESTSSREFRERTGSVYERAALFLNRRSAQRISNGDPAQKLAETRGVFEERGGCARRERETLAKRSAPGVAIFVIFLRQGRGRRVRARGGSGETRETREECMKSIRSHERSKRERDEKETKQKRETRGRKSEEVARVRGTEKQTRTHTE